MRISDRSSDVCSSDLQCLAKGPAGSITSIGQRAAEAGTCSDDAIDLLHRNLWFCPGDLTLFGNLRARHLINIARSEEHTSELQSLMRISYAVFCLKKKTLNAYNQYISFVADVSILLTHTLYS